LEKILYLCSYNALALVSSHASKLRAFKATTYTFIISCKFPAVAVSPDQNITTIRAIKLDACVIRHYGPGT
jgi:hypothetical protein